MLKEELIRRVVMGVASVFSAPIITVSSFALSDSMDDDYMYLQQATQKASQNYHIAEVSKEDYKEIEDGDEAVTNTATDGTGLNLMLINTIETECFVKEYLEICVENENGTLDNTARDVYADVSTIIGINISETGFYNVNGQFYSLPKTDLPADRTGAPIWDGETYSLKNWTVTQHNNSTEPGTKVGGPFQFTPDGRTYTDVGTTSKYNTGTTTETTGDCYLFPDAVCGLNGYIASALSALPESTDESNYGSGAIRIICAVNHNLGTFKYYLYGLDYQTINEGHSSDYVNFDNVSYEEVLTTLIEIESDLKNVDVGYATLAQWALESGSCYVYQNIILLKNGWYIDEMARDNAVNHYSDGVGDVWNAVFPENPVSSAEELKEKLEPYTKKLADVLNDITGMSESVCNATYGTVDGKHRWWDKWTRSDQGLIFKVTDRTSSAYNAGEAPIVYHFDSKAIQHAFSTLVAGDYMYAKMLKYAGVGVDPTNPETYYNQYSTSEWTAELADVVSVIESYGLSAASISNERMTIFKTAYNLYGIPYAQCRNGAGKDGASCDGQCYNVAGIPTHIDCSAYIWRTYKDAGYDTSNFPTNTGSYPGLFEEITFEELQLGDVIWHSGHVMLYLGVSGDNVIIAHASTYSKPSGKDIKSVSYITNGSHKFYRYPGVS